jgi:hypothetical protein
VVPTLATRRATSRIVCMFTVRCPVLALHCVSVPSTCRTVNMCPNIPTHILDSRQTRQTRVPPPVARRSASALPECAQGEEYRRRCTGRPCWERVLVENEHAPETVITGLVRCPDAMPSGINGHREVRVLQVKCFEQGASWEGVHCRRRTGRPCWERVPVENAHTGTRNRETQD